jgi:hypothetical protein
MFLNKIGKYIRIAFLKIGMSNLDEKLNEASTKSEKQEKGEYPEAWMPKDIGARLKGTLTEVEKGRDKKTENVNFLTVKEKNGKEWSVLESAVIASERAKQKIVINDEIGLEFRGKKTSKSGNEYSLFVVVKG